MRRACDPLVALSAHERLRDHAGAVLAFVRGTTAIVDDPRREARWARDLDAREDALRAAYRGHAGDPELATLAIAVDEHMLPFGELAAIIEGCRIDAERRRYATADELRVYLRHTAEPLGRIALMLGGCREPAAQVLVDELSTALALADVLREAGSDRQRGRVYVPADELRRFGVEDDDLAARRATPAVAALVRSRVAHARAALEGARPLLDAAAGELAAALTAAWHGCAHVLDKLAQTGAAVLAAPPVWPVMGDPFAAPAVAVRELARAS
jgi:phytoene/squalene synthetase